MKRRLQQLEAELNLLERAEDLLEASYSICDNWGHIDLCDKINKWLDEYENIKNKEK